MSASREQGETTRRPNRKRWLLHGYRVGVFVLLLLLIHQQHGWFVEQRRGAAKELLEVAQVKAFFPDAAALGEWDPAHGGQNVLDAAGKKLGHVIQTSPEADDVVGFSGPTNSLLAIGKDERLRGIAVLRSDDTREHLREVLEDEAFLAQWTGLSPAEILARPEVDAVSGASLTSMAIADGIAKRLGGRGERTSRFPDEIGLAEVQAFFPKAASLAPWEARPELLRVLDSGGVLLGLAARTSPHADHLLGYQGPIDLLLVLDPEMRLEGIAIRRSFDNEPFVSYLTEDEYFFNTFQGFELAEIAQLDMVDAGIDGVTGATKTSITAAESLLLAAGELTKPLLPPAPPRPLLDLSRRDIGTALVVVLGLVIAFTRLRGKRWLRIALQVVLVGYLGFVNADMLSQALLVGWAQNGIGWRGAPALALLSAAALLAPILTGRQVYCTHLCPFGAGQDWLARKLPWKLGPRGWVDRALRCLPVLLLVWIVIVAMGHLPFSLVGLEPFDAFVFRIAGKATIALAVVGLLASLLVPRAYCRYGCPTGAMLDFLRLGPASDRLGRRDLVAAALAVLALGMLVWR